MEAILHLSRDVSTVVKSLLCDVTYKILLDSALYNTRLYPVRYHAIRFIELNSPELLEYYCMDIRYLFDWVDLTEFAISCNRKDIVSMLHLKYNIAITPHMAYLSVESQHIKIVEWMHSVGAKFPHYAIDCAAASDNLELLKLVHEVVKLDFTKQSLPYAVCFSRWELIEYIDPDISHHTIPERILNAVRNIDHPEVLTRLHSMCRHPNSDNVCSAAISTQNLDMIKLVDSLGYNYTQRHLDAAKNYVRYLPAHCEEYIDRANAIVRFVGLATNKTFLVK